MRREWLLSIVVVSAAACSDTSVASATTEGSSTGAATGASTSGPASTAPPGDDEDDGDGAMSDGSSGGGDETSTPDATGDEGNSTGDSIGTAGCGLATSDPTMQWSEHVIDVDGAARQYWVWLPEPYDPGRAYPVVYQFHGCSDAEDRQNNNPPVQAESGADAIHVRGKAVGSCWDTAGQGPDVAFFDALVADVEATWCADPSRRFATGYSSGAFMTHVLGCVRADVLRGIATIAGGQAGGECSGPVAALLIHDNDDPIVGISASAAARDDHLARNACDAASPTTPFDPAPCEAYAGCDEGLPVVWCQTAGQGHSRQDGLAAPAFWGFLSALSGR